MFVVGLNLGLFGSFKLWSQRPGDFSRGDCTRGGESAIVIADPGLSDQSVRFDVISDVYM